MKKSSNFKYSLLIIALTTLTTSTDSFASRARLLVSGSGDAGTFLGTSGNAGSLSTDSRYNIFYNPAYIVETKNWMSIEKSNVPGTSAQGGFATNLLDRYYVGLFFNRIESMNTLTQASAGIGNNYSRRALMRPVDFTLGTMFGNVKLGLGASYGFYRADKDTRDQDLSLKLGASFSSFDPFIHYKAIGKNKLAANGDEYTHRDISGGLKYTWGEWSPYLVYSSYKINMPGTADNHKTFGFGLSRNSRLTENINYVFSTGYWRSSRPVAKNGGNGYQSIVPVNISAEADITTWMSLRAGLEFRVVDNNNGDSASDRTFGRIGSTFRFGSFNMDWVVGNNAGATTALSEEGSMDALAFDISNRFFTAANITYEW